MMVSEGMGSRIPAGIPNVADAQVPYIKCVQYRKLSASANSASAGWVQLTVDANSNLTYKEGWLYWLLQGESGKKGWEGRGACLLLG